MLETNSLENLAAGKPAGQISFSEAMENYRKNSSWWVVFAVFDLPDFQSSPLWIANKTTLPVEVVVEALEGLALLGYLKKDQGSFYPIKGKEFVKFNTTGRKKAEVIEEHSLITTQVISQMHENTLIAVDHRCFASNVEVLKELYSDIATAFEKAYKASQDSKKNDLILKMTFSAVDVLQGGNK